MTAPKLNKVLFIVGPTATGKTALALELAKVFNGDLISADSRQVYKGLDIVTGKDVPPGFTWTGECYTNGKNSIYGLDLISPNQDWNVALFRDYALDIISQIHSRGRLPIIVGGTGLYIKSLLTPFNSSPPNPLLRQKLDTLSVEELRHYLSALSLSRLNSLNESDAYNPRRLIRQIEIASSLPTTPTTSSKFDSLTIGLTAPMSHLEKKIATRVRSRLAQNYLPEVQLLSSLGLKPTSPAYSSLGYRELNQYLSHQITGDELTQLWSTHERQYAKRQLTWFKAQPDIHWFDITSSYETKVVDTTQAWYSRK